MRKLAFALIGLLAFPALGHAEFGKEDSDAFGTLNRGDFSYRFYVDATDHFPDRIGIICSNADELDKAGLRIDIGDVFRGMRQALQRR